MHTVQKRSPLASRRRLDQYLRGQKYVVYSCRRSHKSRDDRRRPINQPYGLRRPLLSAADVWFTYGKKWVRKEAAIVSSDHIATRPRPTHVAPEAA